jgi:uncharacterized protein YraI
MTKLLVAITILMAVSSSAMATADGCAVVLRTPDGFLALRKGPGTQYPIITRLKPGDSLYADDKPCSDKNPACGWTHITGRPGKPLNWDGWVLLKYVKIMGDCPEPDVDPAADHVACIIGWAGIALYRDKNLKAEEVYKIAERHCKRIKYNVSPQAAEVNGDMIAELIRPWLKPSND